MHIVFILCSVPLILLGCSGLMQQLSSRTNLSWNQRRGFQLLALTAPLIALGIGLSGLHDFLVKACGLSEQLWYTVIVGLLITVACIAGIGLLLSLIRLLLMQHAIGHASSRILTPASLQLRVDTLTAQMRTHRTKIVMREFDQPLALTWGVREPTLLLSTWMVKQLDDEELSAVIAHELAHVARRDFFFAWLTTLLRDAFFYLPTSRAAHAQIKHDNELACDDLATQCFGQPLALASALAKIWGHTLTQARVNVGYSQALLGTQIDVELETRIERLIASSDGVAPALASHPSTLSVYIAGWLALAGLILTNIVFMFGPFGCESTSAICR